MKNVKKLFVAALMVALLGSLTGCIIAERPYPGEHYRYRDPRWRYDRYDRYRDHRQYDHRHRDWDRDRD